MKTQLLLSLFLLVLLSSCNKMLDCTEGNGVYSVSERNTGMFTEVVLEGGFDVVLERGNNSGIRIEADSNLHKYIRAEVSGDKLTLNTEGCLEPSAALRVFVIAPHYTRLEVEGSGSITSKALISTDDELDLTVDGSGRIDLEVHANRIESDIDGSGKIILRGVTEGQVITTDGSGEYQAADLRAQETVVKLKGSGDVDVHSTAALTVAIDGSGNVRYKGAPQKLNSDISGSGKLVQQ